MQQVRLAALWGVMFATGFAWLFVWIHAGLAGR